MHFDEVFENLQKILVMSVIAHTLFNVFYEFGVCFCNCFTETVLHTTVYPWFSCRPATTATLWPKRCTPGRLPGWWMPSTNAPTLDRTRPSSLESWTSSASRTSRYLVTFSILGPAELAGVKEIILLVLFR